MTENQGKTVFVQGRIVWVVGDLFKGRNKTAFNSTQVELDDQGQPIKEYGFGLAVPKAAITQNNMGPGQPGEFWAVMHEQAYSLFPSRVIPPSFAMKYKDGDGVDEKGAPYALREGYAHHIVLACTTRMQIKWFKWENGMNVQVNDGIKCGDYVNVQLNVKAHPAKGNAKAGLYLNPYAVQWLQAGKEIVNTPTGDQIFGVNMPALGGHITPVAPQQPVMPMMGQPMVAAPAPFPQPVATPAPQPHFGVIPQPLQPQPMTAVPAPAATTPAPFQQPVAQPAYQSPMGIPLPQ